MSKYGVVIEDLPEIKNMEIYKTFTEYFDNPLLTKVSLDGISSIYYAKLNSGLMLDNKYLVVIVNNDKTPVGQTRKLSDLHWASLQTRTIRETINCNSFIYKYKRTTPFTSKILLTNRKEGSSIYIHEFLKEISIILINSEKMQYEYPEQGTLGAALETFRTVVVFR
jgi:hypothetical protein